MQLYAGAVALELSIRLSGKTTHRAKTDFDYFARLSLIRFYGHVTSWPGLTTEQQTLGGFFCIDGIEGPIDIMVFTLGTFTFAATALTCLAAMG